MTQDDGRDIDLATLAEAIERLRGSPDTGLRIWGDPGDEWNQAKAKAQGEAYRDALARSGIEMTLVAVKPVDPAAPGAGFAVELGPPPRAKRAAKTRPRVADMEATEVALRNVSRELAGAERERDEYAAVRDAALLRLALLEEAMRKAIAALPPDHPASRCLDDALEAPRDGE